jgi:hypothetical protein
MKEYKKTSTTMKKKSMNMSAANDYEDRNSLKTPKSLPILGFKNHN